MIRSEAGVRSQAWLQHCLAPARAPNRRLALARGATRFTEILARIDGLSDRMLAARLKELEQLGLIVRLVEPTTPVSVRYRLTPRGRDLVVAMQPLAAYGQKWEPAPERDPRQA